MSNQPLDGIRVIDLGHIYQGPYCGLVLAHLGAEVIKVEPPGGETLRRGQDESIAEQFLNANKRGIVVDLKSDAGAEVLKDLVRNSHALVENFSSGTMESLGVGYEDLSAVNPELVYGHGSGFGDDGPYRDYPAMDLTIQAMSGIIHSTGFADGPPVKAGPSICDFLGGIHLATAVVSALFQWERTGEGQYVDVAMFDTTYPMLIPKLARTLANIDVPARTGNRHSGLAAPYNVYAVDDGYVAIAATTDPQWRKLAELIGRSDWLEEGRFATLEQRTEHNDEIDAAIEAWLDGQTKAEAVERIHAGGVACAPVQDLEEVLTDPQLAHRGMLNPVPNRGAGRSEIPVPGLPMQFSASDRPTVEPSPELGADTADVLVEVAGYSEERLTELRESGIVGT
ncbi:CoA transferase [Salinirubellus salinus]|uniref:CoA transferase n=1 Tax=Salinirubellus salinus TaxID=1364945 RepID=A0A9E7R2A9_9EURY|nr:CoA transferase [Salinirubellus salinus]UWM54455.1 CoA transferase [Salinirubellus salinus]